MDLFTHFMMGISLFMVFFGGLAEELLFIAAIFACLPDCDSLIVRPFQRWFSSPYLEHRGGSHSFFIGIGVSGIINLILIPFTSESFLIRWAIGSIFYGLHLALDLLTTTKIPVLYPLSRKEPSLYIEKAGSLFTGVISMILLSFLIPLYLNSQNETFQLISQVSFYSFLVYYGFRGAVKISAKRNMSSTEKYFPGVFPFYYYIYNYDISREIINLQFEKRSIFGNQQSIFNYQKKHSSNDYTRINEALDVCNQDYYSNKWTKIPILHEEKENELKMEVVTVFFLEPYMAKRTTGLDLIYNPIEHNYITTNQSFRNLSQFFESFQ